MIKRSLYIFNPDHDLALASGDVNYMSPASVRQMAVDLALLPAWYASPGSVILAPSAYNLDFLREMQQRLSLPVELMTEPEVASEEELQPMPWGWNPTLRKKLQLLGVPESELPTLSHLEELRSLSHRSCAVELLPRLLLDEFFCGESFYLTAPKEWQQFVERHSSCLLKAPLSGSGKGLNWCKGVFTPFIAGWCKRVATRQGGIVAEPIYNKVVDFAMEFFSDGRGKVTFVGYSVFSTNAGGAYEGNLLLPCEELERHLTVYVCKEAFGRLKYQLEEELSVCFGFDYAGYLGVDMMICRFPSERLEYRIHPCVEVNLRMNMGVVAHFINRNYIASEATGYFSITYHSASGKALHMHEKMKNDFPLHIKGGRVVDGYMPLTPVTTKSAYRAWICVR